MFGRAGRAEQDRISRLEREKRLWDQELAKARFGGRRPSNCWPRQSFATTRIIGSRGVGDRLCELLGSVSSDIVVSAMCQTTVVSTRG